MVGQAVDARELAVDIRGEGEGIQSVPEVLQLRDFGRVTLS